MLILEIEVGMIAQIKRILLRLKAFVRLFFPEFVITFIKNILFLCQKRLDSELSCADIEGYKYIIMDEIRNFKMLNILDPVETIQYIIDNKVSIVRFGDGELTLMDDLGGGCKQTGKDISFQIYDKTLSKKLHEVLISNDPKILICIGHSLFVSNRNFTQVSKNFLITAAATRYRNQLLQYCSFDTIYGDTGFTQIYQTFENFDFNIYFEQVKDIFRNRDISIICGDSIFNGFIYNIFEEVAKSVDYIYAPKVDAFKQYETIFNKAKAIDKSRLIIIVLGPTATVLAFDLAKLGYQALDLGHIAKDYNAFKTNIPRDPDSVANFFRSD